MYILPGILIFIAILVLVVLIRMVLRRKAVLKALRKNVILLDVRSSKEFDEGSLEGAVNIPVDEIESRLDELHFGQCYLVFCSHGIRSLKARSILRKNGFLNVINGGAKHELEQLQEKLSS